MNPRRSLRFEVALVVLLSGLVYVPGIWSYSPVDPWETHYGEVGRMMLQDHDWVHTQWPGLTYEGSPNEGFRSKPVLAMWMMAAGLRTVGVAWDGGYSGEIAAGPLTMLGLRLPFVLCSILGLTLLWWMLAVLVSRRAAWLALLVVGSCPFFAMIARQAIPDMPLVATTMGALAMFALAMEDGARPIQPFARIGRFAIDGRHVVLGITGGFVAIQALYYGYYFFAKPELALRGTMLTPAIWLPALMALMLAALSQNGWLILRLPFVLVGGIIAAIAKAPIREPGVFGTLRVWERYSLDRYLVRGLAFPFAWANGDGWAGTQSIADHLLRMQPITEWRQLYLLGCYSLLGVGVLAKGPPGLTLVGGVGVFYLVMFRRWRGLYDGLFELKRGLILLIVTFLPWHVAMYLKDGSQFIIQYVGMHILDRASSDVDKSPGTFEHYSTQLGHGMWLWAALIPPALAAGLLRARFDSREGRVRALLVMWSIVGFALFGIVTTKFHHYILPVVPALGALVALYLDDILARRDKLHLVYALLAMGIVLLVCRDLMFEPERWVEMYVFRYDRPWPSGDPWFVDPSDGFLGLGLVSCAAIALLATRYVRIGVTAVCLAGLAIVVWGLQVYTPIAGTHWGMREAARTYYEQRTIYGEKRVYFGAAELRDDWNGAGDTYSFDTFIPDALQAGQPMTLTLQVNKADDERATEETLALVGAVTKIGAHTVTVKLAPGERAKIDPLIAKGAKGPRGREPLRVVDADRLIAWQLYWRGENFWSQEEVNGWLPEMKTSFPNPDNKDLNKYLADRARMPIGRRYFVLGDGTRATGIKSLLPTPRSRDSFEVLDQTSNKFALSAFWL